MTFKLPEPAASIWYHRGMPNFDDTDELKKLDDGTGKAINLYTHAQLIQALRDWAASLTPEIAQGWCTPENEHKPMDTVLGEAILENIARKAKELV